MYSNIEDNVAVFEVKRNGDVQTEDLLRAPKGMFPDNIKTFFIKLKWIDDCNYRAFSDESKEMDEISKLLNKNNGILVEKIKIEGKCFYYKSSWTYNGVETSLNGRLCKKN